MSSDDSLDKALAKVRKFVNEPEESMPFPTVIPAPPWRWYELDKAHLCLTVGAEVCLAECPELGVNVEAPDRKSVLTKFLAAVMNHCRALEDPEGFLSKLCSPDGLKAVAKGPLPSDEATAELLDCVFNNGEELDWHPAPADLFAWVEGMVNPEDSEKYYEHMWHCERCRKIVIAHMDEELSTQRKFLEVLGGAEVWITVFEAAFREKFPEVADDTPAA